MQAVAHQISVNDAVQLKSGGPVMVVVMIEGEYVECCWPDGNLRRCSIFRRGMLQPAERELTPGTVAIIPSREMVEEYLATCVWPDGVTPADRHMIGQNIRAFGGWLRTKAGGVA